MEKQKNYTVLPCGEPAEDQSGIEGVVFYVGKTCMVPYGSFGCQTCYKFSKQ